MKIFDCQIRSDTRADDDLKNLGYFETERVVTTAHRLRKFERAEDLLEYLRALVTDECPRLRRCGLTPHVALGVAPDARPRRAHPEVWRELPGLLALPEVVAVGEIGVWEDTRAHWELFERQVKLAVELGPMPIIVTPPSELRITLTYKMMQRIEKLGLPPHLAMMNYVDARFMENVVRSGFVAGLPVGAYSNEPRAAAQLLADVVNAVGSAERIVLNSGLRAEGADVLGIPKTVVALQDLGMASEVIEQLVYGNAMAVFVG